MISAPRANGDPPDATRAIRRRLGVAPVAPSNCIGHDGAVTALEPALRARCVLIDLHCHTNLFSGCSSLEAPQLARLARQAGLDAICLTEHDRTWTADEVQALSEASGLVVLRGMEVTTELGHVLVFGLNAPVRGMYIAASLREHVLAADALMFLAHPSRPGQPGLDLIAQAALFDGVEGLNGSDTAAQNASAAKLCAGLRLPAIGGSDCHSPREVATAATLLARPVSSERELVAELRRGRHVAIDTRLGHAAK